MDMGSARLGMTVAERLRRKRKITRITRPRANSRVNCTSFTDSRMVAERSYSVSTFTDAGIWFLKVGKIFLMESTTWMVLVPGWRWMAKIMAREFLYQEAILSFSTLLSTWPRSARRTGWPFR